MRLIISTGLGVDRPEDYAALKNYLMSAFAQPPSELVSANPQAVDPLVNQLAAECGVPITRFPVPWTLEDGTPNHGAAKLNVGDMVTYAMEVPGSACVVVASQPSELMLHTRAVCTTYEVPCHLVQVAATRYDKPGAPATAKDVTATSKVVEAPEPYIFPQSFSSLNVFDTCPRQYEAKYITREVQYKQSDEAKWGDEVHMALENYLKTEGSMGLPSNMAMYKPFGDWVLQRAAAGGAKVYAERNLAVDKNLKACAYKDKARWMGAKIDVTLLYPQHSLAEVFDWKTGKMKNDETQLKLYGSMTLAAHPDIHQVRSGYIWLKDQVVSPPMVFTRENFAINWETFQFKYSRLRDAYVRGVFPPKPNGLCAKWCDVTSCEFHGRGR